MVNNDLKTWQVINGIVAKKKSGMLRRGLVVCKASLLFNWRDEIRMHSNERPVVIAGTPKQRAHIYSDLTFTDWTFAIISYDTFRRDLGSLKLVQKMKGIDFCVLDEGHVIKNPTSKIGTRIHSMDFDYRYVLTATPIPNTPLEAYNYLKWGGKTERNWYDFQHRYAILGGRNGKDVVAYKNILELRRLLQSCMLRRLKKDKLKELPDVSLRKVRVPMTDSQKRLYRAVVESIYADLADTSLDKVPSARAKLLRLQQITNDPSLIGARGKSAKLEAIDELLESIVEAGGEKVIIFSKFKSMVDLLTERYAKYNPAIVHGDTPTNGYSRRTAIRKLREEGVAIDSLPKEEREKLIELAMSSERQKQVYKFQGDDSCRLFIGCAPACREGLTLTAATHVIFIDCEWAWDYVYQAYSRAHRIGQKAAITVHFILCEHTVDENVLDVVLTKKRVSEYMLDEDGLGNIPPTLEAREFILEMIKDRSAITA